MTQTSLIINSPYDKPQQHWAQDGMAGCWR